VILFGSIEPKRFIGANMGNIVQPEHSFTDSGVLLHLSVPVLSRDRFADLVGLPPGVVVGFINKGYIPTVSIGKYSLVNVELLRKNCLEREFSR
jgi:hypothetical protein